MPLLPDHSPYEDEQMDMARFLLLSLQWRGQREASKLIPTGMRSSPGSPPLVEVRQAPVTTDVYTGGLGAGLQHDWQPTTPGCPLSGQPWPKEGEEMATIRESDLPGIGRKFQVETRSGERLVIIVHDTGTRELYHTAAHAPDTMLSRVALDDAEARQVAGIIGGMTYQPRALEAVEIALQDLMIEWYAVEPTSKAVARSIGDLRVRRQTGASIIAMIEPDSTVQINPGPDQVVHAGATLVVVGSRAHIQMFKQLIVQGAA